MELINLKDRWVYRGSVTVPPCETYVYWNVPTVILPISEKHLSQFKSVLQRGETDYDLVRTGNIRATQEIRNHQPMFITSSLNKAAVNINGKINVAFNEDGNSNVKLSAKLRNHKSEIIPRPNGVIDVYYEDQLKRKIEVLSDGLCFNVKMCGYQNDK